MPVAALTTPDTIVLVVCTVLALRGAWKGFAWQAVRVVGPLAALWGAFAWHEPVGAWLDQRLGFLPDALTPSIGFVVVLLALLAVGTWLAWMARGAVRTVRLGDLDRLFGFLLGGLLGFTLVTIGFALWGSWVSRERLQETFEDSRTVRYMGEVVEAVESILPTDIRERWGKVLHTLDEVEPR